MLVNMQEMLADARNRKYAVGMFDVSDLEMIRAVTEEAENLQSPVILGALAPDLTKLTDTCTRRNRKYISTGIQTENFLLNRFC